MAKSSDIGSKRLISLAPEEWVNWITQTSDLKVMEVINTGFEWISRESDILIRVENAKHKEFLVLNELQLRYKLKMPKRVRAYTALAEEKYDLPVYPVLINILKTSDAKIPTAFKSKFMGLTARQDYRVINLWEIDAQVAFNAVPSLLPFVPVLQNGANEATITQALRVIRTSEQLEQFDMLLGFFASFMLDKALVQNIMRLDMAILQESPWYQQIFGEGEQVGEKRGEQRGILAAIELGLEIKFGTEALELMESVFQVQDLEKLKVIKDAIKSVNTVDELQQLI